MPGRKLDDTETLKGKPGRILVVDDEPVVAELVVTVLRAVGHEVTSLTDSADVLQTLTDGHYEVVITDLSMPGLSGLDLIRRGRERGLDVQWIIFTGTGSYDDAIAAVRYGAYDYMRKPIRDLDVLRTTVARAVATHRLAADRRRLVDLVASRNRQLRDQMTAMEDALGVTGAKARDLAEDLDHARRIELSLLPPKLPYTERISFHAFYHASQRVGGDLYDVMRIGPHHVAAYVADAAGHGVSAAMMAVLVKQCIQPGEPGSPGVPQPPAAVLDALTQRINRQTEDTCLFVSMAYLLVDTRDLSAVFASAGHPAAVLMSEDRTVRQLAFTGPAIGVQPDPIYREVELQLTEGDRLLLFTDGLTEVRDSDGAFFGHEGICTAMGEHHDDPDRIVPELLRRASRFGGDEGFDDDVTMLLLSVDGLQHGKIHKQRRRSRSKLKPSSIDGPPAPGVVASCNSEG
ncbi:MAG: SpoIIE family protein phosphatase [Planctomycetes bacterium]|nr:SpoIIE family protein phosphatase [Planctomycetota bacterium]